MSKIYKRFVFYFFEEEYIDIKYVRINKINYSIC